MDATKYCSSCKQSLSEVAFFPSIWRLPGKSNHCRACMLSAAKLRNRQGERAANYKANLRQTRDRRLNWWRNVRTGLKCKICGESRPACLDFHHRDPATKEFQVSWAVGYGYSIKRILAEMAKCDVICANCHRCQHHSETLSGRRPTKQIRVLKNTIPV